MSYRWFEGEWPFSISRNRYTYVKNWHRMQFNNTGLIL